MQASQLVESFEGSLSHAQGNYQMVVLESLADCPQLLKEELVNDLMRANKEKTRTFFNSHCVFKVLKNKGLIKENSSKEFSLNLSKPTKGTEYSARGQVLASAKKARKAYEVSHQ